MMLEEEPDPSDEEGPEIPAQPAAAPGQPQEVMEMESEEVPPSPTIPELGTDEAAARVLESADTELGSEGTTFARPESRPTVPNVAIPAPDVADLSLTSAGIVVSPVGRRDVTAEELPGAVPDDQMMGASSLADGAEVLSEASPPETHRTGASGPEIVTSNADKAVDEISEPSPPVSHRSAAADEAHVTADLPQQDAGAMPSSEAQEQSTLAELPRPSASLPEHATSEETALIEAQSARNAIIEDVTVPGPGPSHVDLLSSETLTLAAATANDSEPQFSEGRSDPDTVANGDPDTLAHNEDELSVVAGADLPENTITEPSPSASVRLGIEDANPDRQLGVVPGVQTRVPLILSKTDVEEELPPQSSRSADLPGSADQPVEAVSLPGIEQDSEYRAQSQQAPIEISSPQHPGSAQSDVLSRPSVPDQAGPDSENLDPQMADGQSSSTKQAMKDIPLEFQMLNVATGQELEDSQTIEDLAEAYRVRQRSRLYRIQELKQKLETSEVPVYHEEMKAEAMQDSAVTIGSVSVQDLQEQYKAVEDARLRAAKEERRLHRRRQDIIHRQEQEAIHAVSEQVQSYQQKKRQLEEERIARDQNRSRSIRVALSSAQDQFLRSLRAREVSMKSKVGVLGVDKEKRAHLLATKKQWKLSAALATVPHPIKVRVDTVRVVRDKLQRGHYVTIVTLLNKIGGKPLRFAGAGDFYKTRSRAVPHSGRHFDLDLLINEYLFLLCPAERELTASLVLLFEVYECKSRLVPMDRCVGWTVFPLVNAGFQLVKGKFKAPLIRGEYDSNIKLHQELEDKYKDNLDNWLGNIYFKISRMSRYLHQDKEYALRMEYTSNLLGFEPYEGPLRKHVDSSLQEIKIEGAQESKSDSTQAVFAGDTSVSNDGPEPSTETAAALKHRKSTRSNGSARSGLAVSFSRKGSKTGQGDHFSKRNPPTGNTEDDGEKADAEVTDDEKKGKGESTPDVASKKKEVEWEKIFAAEKLKIETGDDPEDDGLTDVSDTEDESENEHWETRYRVTSRLSRKVMARTAEGAVLHIHGAVDPYDSGSASDSAGPELEDIVKRPKDDGRTSFLREDSKKDSDAGHTDSDDAGKGAAQSQGTEAKAEKAGSEKSVLSQKLTKLGGKSSSKASTHKSLADSQEKVKEAINLFNKGKIEKSFELDPKKPKIQIVKFDKRLSSYTQTLTSFKDDGKNYNQTFFLLSEAVNDLRLNNWRLWAFWASVLLVLIAMEFRMHVHYLAGFAVLSLTSRPLYKLEPGWFRWEIKYSPISTTTEVELGMLCAGPAAVFLVWGFIALFIWGTSKITRVDMITYRIVGILGVVSCLDWQLTLIADLISMAFFNCEPQTSQDFIENRALLKQAAEDCTAESYRLWFHFRVNEGNGAIAPAFVFIVYVGMSSVMWVLLYTYFLNVHGAGRILDLYRRLTSKEGSLFMPLDTEISPAELVQVLQSTKRWRGKDGGSRQLVVTELEVEFLGLDDDSKTGKQQLTHIGVYTVHQSGDRELHRHFLRLADGALVEIVGEEIQYVVSKAVLNAVDKVVTECLQDDGKFVSSSKRAMREASRLLNK